VTSSSHPFLFAGLDVESQQRGLYISVTKRYMQ
jgi:hypothetical protein